MYNWLVRVLIMGSITTMIILNSDPARVAISQPRTLVADHNNLKIRRFETTDPHPVAYAFDNFFMCFFTVELIVRWIVCTSQRDFFKTFINIIELLVLGPKWAVFVLSHLLTMTIDLLHYPAVYWTYFILSLFIVFRIVRLMKVCLYYTRMTVLFLTIKASSAEISFLLYLLGIVSVMFGVMIYHAEAWENDTFLDLPTAVYWACMTVNVVGYGDIVPKSTLGRGIAIMCCLSGVLFTGLAVPIISSNFRQYHEHLLPMQVRQRRGNSISEVRKMAGLRTRAFSNAHNTAKILGRGRHDRMTSMSSSISFMQDDQNQYTSLHNALLHLQDLNRN